MKGLEYYTVYLVLAVGPLLLKLLHHNSYQSWLVPIFGVAFLIGVGSLAVILKSRHIERQNRREVE